MPFGTPSALAPDSARCPDGGFASFHVNAPTSSFARRGSDLVLRDHGARGVGHLPPVGRRVGASGRRALRDPSECRPSGSGAVVSRADPRVAQGGGRARGHAARGAPDPQAPARSAGAAGHRRPHARPRRRAHRRHGTAGSGWQFRHCRPQGRVLPWAERHRRRRCDRTRDRQWEGDLSRRANLGR